MTEKHEKYVANGVESKILLVRGQRIILDADIAVLYGVSTKRLNEQIKRNKHRFPPDFMFRLTQQEVRELNRSQIATGFKKHRDPRFLPYAFTEHGALMAANVLNSDQAVEMSVFIVRAFLKLREKLATTATLEKRLGEIEANLINHDAALRDIYNKIKPLLLAPPLEKPKRHIGFTAKEKRMKYSKD